MKIISDFDDVLFNNKKFKGVIFDAIATTGPSIEDVGKMYERVRATGTPFSLKDFINIFVQSDTHTSQVYEAIMSRCKDMVNEEVLQQVRSVGDNNVYIVTTGEEEYQKDKIRRSLGNIFSNIRIVPASKSTAVEEICAEVSGNEASRNDDIIFVDDKGEHFENLQSNEDFAPHLKTVLFSEYGLETLRAEMKESEREEAKRKGENMGNMSEINKMR